MGKGRSSRLGTGTHKPRKSGRLQKMEQGRAQARPLHKFFVSNVVRHCFSFWFAAGVGEGGFEHFGDAAVAGCGGAVIEDGEQVAAALQGRHGLPTSVSARIAGEGELENGWKLELGFHGGEQLLGDLFSAAEAGCGIFYVDDPIANPLTHGVVEMVEPAAEGAVFVEDALEFPGDGDDAFCGVGFEVEESGIARSSVRAGLHAFVDEQVVIALAGGEERGAKGEAVDFALYSEHAAGSPDLWDVEGDADDHPSQVRSHAFQR